MKKNKDSYAGLRGENSKCKMCWGWGLWGIGDNCQMGPMDFRDGSPTIKCPECGAGNRKEYWLTAEGKLIYVRNITDEHLKNIVKHLDERGDKDTKARRLIEKEVKRRKK